MPALIANIGSGQARYRCKAGSLAESCVGEGGRSWEISTRVRFSQIRASKCVRPINDRASLEPVTRN